MGRRDSCLSVFKTNATRSSLYDTKWDRHIWSPFCQVTKRCEFHSAKRKMRKTSDVLHEPLFWATIVVVDQFHCLWSQWVIEGGRWWGWLLLWDKLWWPRWG